ncbi:MmcQ/YjbR family DNA-binding protein [Catenulispora yoronensis]
MSDPATARRLAASLPEAEDQSEPESLAIRLRGKLFAWSYLERVDGTGPRVPQLDVLAVQCAHEEKEALISARPDAFFTTEHYRGYPAVLVRLAEIDDDELRTLLVAAWRMRATKTMARQYADELD